MCDLISSMSDSGRIDDACMESSVDNQRGRVSGVPTEGREDKTEDGTASAVAAEASEEEEEEETKPEGSRGREVGRIQGLGTVVRFINENKCPEACSRVVCVFAFVCV